MKYINKSIAGYKGMKIPYTLFGKNDDSQELIVLLPGAGYTVNSPVFHYLSGILFEQSKDILEVNYPYNNEFYNDFNTEEIHKAVKIDSRLVIDSILETTSYKRYVFIGKSIGTIAMSSELKRDEFKDAEAIWLTPLLNLDAVYSAIVESGNKGLCILGDKDRVYSKELFDQLRQNENLVPKLISGANHSLDYYDNDVFESIDILKNIITEIQSYLLIN